MKRQLIAKLILEVVQDYVDSQEGGSTQIKVQENMALFDNDAEVDSLGLVSIIVDVETRFREQGFDELTLTSGEILARADSPFRTVSTLIDYVDELTE